MKHADASSGTYCTRRATALHGLSTLDVRAATNVDSFTRPSSGCPGLPNMSLTTRSRQKLGASPSSGKYHRIVLDARMHAAVAEISNRRARLGAPLFAFALRLISKLRFISLWMRRCSASLSNSSPSCASDSRSPSVGPGRFVVEQRYFFLPQRGAAQDCQDLPRHLRGGD